MSSIITFSPTGVAPIAVTKTAESPTSVAGGTNGYTITINNPNPGDVTVNSITDTLPAGFTYIPGSTTGLTTADPSISGQTLEWTGPFVIPGGGSASLTFDVNVSTVLGTYFNSATADAGIFTVAPSGDTAPIRVNQAQPTLTTQAASSGITATTNPAIFDTATLTGGNAPTGTITFDAYGPNDANCTGPIAFTDTAVVSGNGNYTSDPFFPPALGAYRWVVSYTGDAGNAAATSPCNAPNEIFQVTTICSVVPRPGGNVIMAQPGVVTMGTSGDDVIYGTQGNDQIAGLEGNDVIFGGGGDDEITGGDGHDTICGGSGDDRITGSGGDDLLSGDDGNDDLAGRAGNDRLFGGLGDDRLVGADGNDTCTAGGQAGDQNAPSPSCDVIV